MHLPFFWGSDSIGPPELKVGHRELGEGAGMLLTWTQMSCKMAVNGLERNSSLSTRTNLQTRQKNRQCVRERERERDGKLNQQPSRVSAAIPNLALLSGPCGQCHLCGVPRQLPPNQHTHFEERTTALPADLWFLGELLELFSQLKENILMAHSGRRAGRLLTSYPPHQSAHPVSSTWLGFVLLQISRCSFRAVCSLKNVNMSPLKSRDHAIDGLPCPGQDRRLSFKPQQCISVARFDSTGLIYGLINQLPVTCIINNSSLGVHTKQTVL